MTSDYCGNMMVCGTVRKRSNSPIMNNSASAQVRIERKGDAGFEIGLQGAWRAGNNPASVKESLSSLDDQSGMERIVLRDDGLTGWDSSLLVFLRALSALARQKGSELDVSGLPEGVQRLLGLADNVSGRAGDRIAGRLSPSLVSRIGELVLAGFRDFFQFVAFLGELTMAFGALLRGRARYRGSELWATIQECGPEALPIISLISILVGMILAFLGAVQLQAFGAELFIADAVAVGMVREMGALMTGIIMAGRTGASFAARLGTMQVNEEIDALKTMGFSPIEFLVLPRALALILMMPLLSIYAVVLGILGGAIVGVFMLDLTPIQYYMQTVNAVSIQAIASGLIKSSVFGVVVAVSGCLQGVRCGRSAAAVGEATTAAVVNAIVYIIVADSLISVIYVITGF